MTPRMVPEWVWDEEADAGYLRLRRERVASTSEIFPGVLVDLSETGDVLGIEIL